jgi:anti-sigma B factor antagonist
MSVDLITRELPPDITVMALTGRLILGDRLKEVEQAIRQRIQQGARKVVLDFSGLDYIDSSGIGVVAACIATMQRSGGTLAVVVAEGHVKRFLELTRLDRVAKTYPDLPSARTALARPATPPPPS